jgi:hypothetical protein
LLSVDMRASKIDEGTLCKVSDVMKAHPGEKPVHLHLSVDDFEVELKLPKARAVRPTDELIMALEESVKQIMIRRE